MPPILTENGCAPTELKPGQAPLGLCPTSCVVGDPTILVAGLPARFLSYGPRAVGALAGHVSWLEPAPGGEPEITVSKTCSKRLCAAELSPDIVDRSIVVSLG